MSDLNFTERQQLEQLLRMRSGYVLDFCNRTFQEFVLESVGMDILADAFSANGDSKANRLRTFWKLKPNPVVGRLLGDLMEYARASHVDGVEASLLDSCSLIAKRLLTLPAAPDVDALSETISGTEFVALISSVRSALSRNQPAEALDRLHTLVLKFMRGLSCSHGLPVDRDRPLHNLIGGYVKHLRKNSLLESKMTEHILKSAITVFDAFNLVRNERSFAHDNDVLNYDESLLIVDHVISTVRFISAVETRVRQSVSVPVPSTTTDPST
ncbi:MAG: abortive infection family protein [Candidatus Riflebacteria bacterium]|nr:abortive infection family protein [Candidatus Riflebacteria bacterium]